MACFSYPQKQKVNVLPMSTIATNPPEVTGVPRGLGQALNPFKADCVLQDDEYWDLEHALVRHREEMNPTFRVTRYHSLVVTLSTVDGFVIDMMFVQSSCFGFYWNGYVTVQEAQFPLLERAVKESHQTELQYELGIHVELTYKDRTTIGWDHAHGHDAKFDQTLHAQPGTVVSGPVQVLEEALEVVKALRRYNTRIEMSHAHERVRQYTEELMQKAWHPKRVLAWVESGLDVGV